MAKHKILLVDYDPRNIKQFKEVLTPMDCEIEVALDGIAALNLFPQVKPDLIIIEAMLPKKHGFDVCHEIKKTPQGKNIPVIITTHVYKGRKYRDQAFHIYCCDEYIEKPVSDQILLDTIKKFLPGAKESQEQPEEEKSFVEAKAKVAVEEEKKEVVLVAKKVAVIEEDASVDSKILENEISSKVDEILTLFSDAADQKPAEEKEEVKAEAKPKKKTKKRKKETKAKAEAVVATPAKEEVKKEEVKASEEPEEPQKVEVETVVSTAQEEAQKEIQEAATMLQEQSKEILGEAKASQEADVALQEETKAQSEEAKVPHEATEVSREEDQAPIEEAKEPKAEVTVLEEEAPKAEEAKEEKLEEVELEEPLEKVPEELLAILPKKRKFFNSWVFIISLASIVFLAIMLVFFPIFKGKGKESSPIQSGISLSPGMVKSETDSVDDFDSLTSDPMPLFPVSTQDDPSAMETSNVIATPALSDISQSKQPEASAKENLPRMKPKEEQTVKQEPIQTASLKVPPATDRNVENIRAPSSKPDSKSSTSVAKPITSSTVKKQQKSPSPLEKISEDSSKKSLSEEAKTASESKTVFFPPVEKKEMPSSTKIDSEKQTQEVSSIKTEKESPAEQEILPADKQSLTEKIVEPFEQKESEQPRPTTGISAEQQKQTETVQAIPEQVPQAKEPPSPPLPKEGQMIDYSLLDREPSYLAHESPKYPFIAKLKGVEGKVILRVLILETGYVGKVELVKGLEDSIDEAAITAAKNWVYRPPVSQGVRVKTLKTETLAFPPKS